MITLSKEKQTAIIEAIKEAIRLSVFATISIIALALIDVIPQLEIDPTWALFLTGLLRSIDRYTHKYKKEKYETVGESHGLLGF